MAGVNNPARAQYQNYMLALRKWREKQGIVDYAPTPTGMEGRAGGAAMIPVSPYAPSGIHPTSAKAPVELPEGYQESLSNAIGWLESKGDSEETRWQVFQKLSVAFPERSAELKRIFIPSAKLGELNIIDELKALRGK